MPTDRPFLGDSLGFKRLTNDPTNPDSLLMTLLWFYPPDPKTNQCSGSPLKRPERNASRLRLYCFQWIYELTGARHALH